MSQLPSYVCRSCINARQLKAVPHGYTHPRVCDLCKKPNAYHTTNDPLAVSGRAVSVIVDCILIAGVTVLVILFLGWWNQR